jgi:Zinc carboxypeptidase
MKSISTFVFLLLWGCTQMAAQGQPLSYYLPGETFDTNIPTPESILGYPVGEWHVTHDQLLYYMRELAAASDKVQIQEYARSHEGRALVMLTISSTRNLANLESIKKQHQQLSDHQQGAEINIDNLPAVIHQGYSVHGNESSGANAALVVAYRLAASQHPDVKELLDNVVVLLDPCFNPDGLHRFSTWANMHKSKYPVTNSESREFNEVWPGGRTNHYWFDLNRDWLMAVHPESQGRLRIFQDWLPNILTDHHEMGSDATFFFQPGIPSRTNPNTPALNQELTKKIGTYHAAQLDKLGSLYYTEESFDDFYYGKGSTYPDVQGCIGILFEQASSRGHIQDTENGRMTFAFTIRNQVAVSLSTQKAAVAMRKELLNYKRDFFKNAIQEARNLPQAAFVFGESHDQGRLAHFVELLNRHQIDIYALDKDISSEGKLFKKGQAYVVPLLQKQSKLIQSIFERRTSFTDSLFYDVSAWTIPLAYNLDYAALDAKAFSAKGEKIRSHTYEVADFQQSNYAYLLDWDEHYAPRVLNKLLQRGLRVKVAHSTFRIKVGDSERDFQRGCILIPVQNQLDFTRQKAQDNNDLIYPFLQQLAREDKVAFYSMETGLTSSGIDLGSQNFDLLRSPRVLLVGGEGVSAYDAGEVWHLLDQHYQMPPVIVEAERMEKITLSNYNSIVMVSGSYGSISAKAIEAVKDWVRQGGVLIVCGSAIRWAESSGLANVTFKTDSTDKTKTIERRPYAKQAADSGTDLVSGAIFQTELDLTHPLAYGFYNQLLPVFRKGALVIEPGKNPYSSPAIYSKNPLLAGYASRKNQQAISGSAAISVTGIGKGRVIALADNPVFRGFWLGTNKLFANALFFGHTIGGEMSEKAKD